MKRKKKECNLYKRIEYIDRVRKAYIMWKDIPIAELYHEYFKFNWGI